MTNRLNKFLRAAGLALVLVCAGNVCTPRAAAQHLPMAGKKLWNAYISAAEFSTEKKDFDAAQVALQAALKLAHTGGPQEPRLFITYVFLALNAYDRDDRDAVKEYFKTIGNIKLAPELFDTELLAAADTLYMMADNRYGAWKAMKTDAPGRSDMLKEAEYYMVLAYRIRKRLLKEGDPKLSATESYFGLILFKEDDLAHNGKQVDEMYQEAVKDYVEAEKRDLERQRYTQSFSLMRPEEQPGHDSGNSHHISDDALSMRWLLGQNFLSLGDSYANAAKSEKDAAKKKEDLDAAAAAYENAEKTYREELKVYRSEWDSHIDVGVIEWWLADVYERQGKVDQAVEALRAALPVYVDNYGRKNANVKSLVEQLASLLEKHQREEEAAKVRSEYDVPKPKAAASK